LKQFHMKPPNHRRSALRLFLVSATTGAALNAQQPAPPTADLVIRNATLMTASHGTIEHGSVWVHAGKIAGVGETVNAPASAVVLDAAGEWLTPGIIDPHSHSALDSDVNEATSPVTPSMHMIDAFDNRSADLYRALAGGVTTELLLHGSANMIGGQAVVIKNKFGLDRDAMLFPNAPGSIKFASGENPKRVYGGRDQLPSTRMGNFEVMRMAFEDARHYMAEWDAYNAKVAKGDKDAAAPKRDLKLEALADVLRGKLYVQIHCYRADEFLTEEAIAKEYGYKIRAFPGDVQGSRQNRRRPDRHRHLQRLVGVQGRGLGRHSVERCIVDAQGRPRGAEERFGRPHPAPEPGGRQDGPLWRRHRG